MSILVTGGAGFIGTALVKRLADMGERVIVIDHYGHASCNESNRRVIYYPGSTADIMLLHLRDHSILADVKLIYHLGEYSRVQMSFAERDLVTAWTLDPIDPMLKFWRSTKAIMIYAGSSTRFASAESPYMKAKRASAEMIEATAECSGLPYTIAYLCNAFGPGERGGHYGTLIEKWRQLYLEGKPLPIHAPGTQRRNFTHIDDIVDAFILLAQKGEGGSYTIANSQSWSLLEVAEMFGGSTTTLCEAPGDRHDTPIDLTRIHELGWRAKRTLAEYIEGIKKEGSEHVYTE